MSKTAEFDLECVEMLRRACTIARALGHSFVGSGHILLSMFETPGCRDALSRHGADRDRLYALAVKILGCGCSMASLPQGLSDGAKRAIALAASQELPLRPERLLWAIAADHCSTASLMLAGAGINSDELCDGRLHRKAKEEQKMRLLEQFGTDMLEQAGSAGPVIGREREIEEIIEVLCRRHKNNPALVGEPGVGKTAIVEGLAIRMADGKVPPQLRKKRLYCLETAAMVAGTKYRGEFEERMRDLLEEIGKAGNMIVFIDEMHMLSGAGAAEGAIDAANILKPALSRGRLHLIGATTTEEWRKFIEKDAALERRFRCIRIDEPTAEETAEILRGLRPGLERHHGLKISEEAVDAAVRLSGRYLSGYFFPDKALDLLDEGASHAAACASAPGQRGLDGELKDAIDKEDFAKAMSIQAKLRSLYTHKTVRAADVAYALSRRTGIPAERMTGKERERLWNLERRLGETVIGQTTALRTVADAVRRGRSNLAGAQRPMAAILLTGPTGTGKTLLCKALAKEVYGAEQAMIRLDMTEYAEPYSASRMLGAPPGYVGYDEGGTLTERVRRNPYSLVLFDEIDKACPEVRSVLLQLMDEGRLTDSVGRTVDFRNTLVLMTANVGADEAGGGMGFAPADQAGRIRSRLKQHFSPEFLGRLDTVAVFEPLNDTALAQIAAQQLQELRKQFAARGFRFSWDPQAPELIVRRSGREAGARGIRSAVTREVASPLAKLLLEEQKENAIFLNIRDNELVLDSSES